MDKEEAITKLARRLHWTMERFDPSEDENEWDDLSETRRDFFRACVRELLLDLGSDRPAVLITQEMIQAGVAVYSDPGRYESYEQTVTRIFSAMAGKCAPKTDE